MQDDTPPPKTLHAMIRACWEAAQHHDRTLDEWWQEWSGLPLEPPEEPYV